MRIPFYKAHGAGNDFLMTWAGDVQAAPRVASLGGDSASYDTGYPNIARAICDRHTGVGADGWMLVTPSSESEPNPAIRLFNSDGSEPEMSGNGTRCAAAFLIYHGKAGEFLDIRTGAGLKRLRLMAQKGMSFEFEMNMGTPRILELRAQIHLANGECEASLIDVGNPQCAVMVENFDFDWRGMGAELERHARFPNRTNVSFIRAVDQHSIDVRFYERGAGETMSSGTGSTGAAACAVARGLVSSPVTVLTPAGPLVIRAEGDYFLAGPAVITAEGAFYWYGEGRKRK